MRGSRISASDNVYLTADNDIHLLAGEMTDEQHTRSSSSSAAVGAAISFGSDGMAIGLYVEGSAGRGKADGSDLVHNNTQIQAGNEVHFNSGGDTVLRGAVIEGERVVGRVGGDLQIESLQDLSSYSSRNRHIGGSATIGYGASVQGSASSQKINSDYASVGEQSSIRAGDGGFDIEVEGTTRLIGGAITSTDAAVEADLNRFNQNTEEGLARLEMSDIQNHADYRGSGYSVSGGFSAPAPTAPTSEPAPGSDGPAAEGSKPQQSSAQVLHGSGGSHQSAGIGRVSGSDGSITESGISGLAGNAELRTGDDESGIDQIFDLNRVQNELDTQIMVTAEFGRISSQAWGEYAGAKEAQLWLEAQNEGDPDIRAELEAEASRWGEGGIYRISGHTLIGLAGGGIDGATGALASSVAMPEVARLTAEMELPEGVRQGLESVVAGLIGTVAGNSGGGAMAFNIDTNNRQLHSFEQSLAELLAVDSEYSAEQIADALRAMYNDELGEAPNANIIVNIQNPDAGDLSPAHGDMIVDEGGTWIYAGNGNYVQSVPRDIDPGLVAYIVSQTGGEDSPYRQPVHVTGAYDPVRQHLFPGSIAQAAGLPYNLNMPDLRTQDEIDAGQDRLTTTMSHMVALPVSGTYALANLGVKGTTYVLLTGSGVGGGFNAAGQWVQNGEIRPGEVMIASYTGAAAAPFASTSMLFNGVLGSYIGGTNAVLTNEWFNESRNVGQAATDGFFFAWLGTFFGKRIADQAKIILPSHVGGKIIDPKIPILLQNTGVQNPWPNYLGNAVERGVSNLPDFYSSSDSGGE